MGISLSSRFWNTYTVHLVFCCLFVFSSCCVDEHCREFLSIPVEEEFDSIRDAPLRNKVEHFICRVKRVETGETGESLAWPLAENGDKIIPILMEYIESEKSEWVKSRLIYVLKITSQYYCDISDRNDLLSTLQNTVTSFRMGSLKRRTEKELIQILGGSVRPQPKYCQEFWRMKPNDKIAILTKSTPVEQVDLYLCVAEERYPSYEFVRPIFQNHSAEFVQIAVEKLSIEMSENRIVWLLRAINEVTVDPLVLNSESIKKIELICDSITSRSLRKIAQNSLAQIRKKMTNSEN